MNKAIDNERRTGKRRIDTTLNLCSLCAFSNASNTRGKFVGLVLARGGSKGLRKKNLAMLNGTTLLGRSLRTMKQFGSKYANALCYVKIILTLLLKSYFTFLLLSHMVTVILTVTLELAE